jgi:hypothetical protein
VELFEFQEGAITIGGTPTAPTTILGATGGTAVADIRDFTMLIANNIDGGGFNLGGGGMRVRKPAVGLAAATGTITAEFDSTVLRDAQINQTDLALVLTMTGSSTIGSGSDKPVLQIYIPNIRLEVPVMPHGAVGEVLIQPLAFTVVDNLAAPPFTIVYVSTDTLP